MKLLRLLIMFYESPKIGLHASKVNKKKHFSFLKTNLKIFLDLEPNF